MSGMVALGFPLFWALTEFCARPLSIFERLTTENQGFLFTRNALTRRANYPVGMRVGQVGDFCALQIERELNFICSLINEISKCASAFSS